MALRSSSVFAAAFVMSVVACAKEKPAPADSATSAPNAAPAAPTAATVSPSDLRALRWLEGRWRGADSATLVFYEEYRFVDDSTISSRTLADSTFARATDSSSIALRAGRLESVGGGGRSVWVATRIDSTRVEFARVGATNRFVWERAPTGWIARLYSGAAGAENERVYRMTPVAR